MKTFSQYLKKEALEAVRTNRYIILLVGTIFWALMDPLMLKLLPILVQNSMSMDMTALLPDLTRDTAFINFAGDLFEIGTLFFGFTLMGIISSEIRFKKLIFPRISGASPAGIVMAKYVHYCLVLSVFITAAFMTNYFYTIKLFEGGILSAKIILGSAVLYAFYYCFLLALLMYLSSLYKRGLFAGISVIVFAYTMTIFNRFPDIRGYFPNYLLLKAQDILGIFDATLIPTVLVTAALIILFILLTINRLRKIDIV